MKCANSGTCAQFAAGGMQHSHAHGGLKEVLSAHREWDGADPVLGLRT